MICTSPGIDKYVQGGGFKKDVPGLEEVVVQKGVARFNNQESAEDVNNHVYDFIKKFWYSWICSLSFKFGWIMPFLLSFKLNGVTPFPHMIGSTIFSILMQYRNPLDPSLVAQLEGFYNKYHVWYGGCGCLFLYVACDRDQLWDVWLQVYINASNVCLLNKWIYI